LPTVSLILPIRNEATHIRGCLQSIAQQDFPHEQMEIIIADGLSTDDTKEVVEAFKPSDIPLIWLDNPGKIVPTGLNLAIRQARGEIIIRVDGHTILAPDYVRECVHALQRSKLKRWRTDEPCRENFFGKAVAFGNQFAFWHRWRALSLLNPGRMGRHCLFRRLAKRGVQESWVV